MYSVNPALWSKSVTRILISNSFNFLKSVAHFKKAFMRERKMAPLWTLINRDLILLFTQEVTRLSCPLLPLI